MTIHLPTQALAEYNATAEKKVYLFTGSKITGGFCVTRKGLLEPSKPGHILTYNPALQNYQAAEGEFIKYKGRSYCWVSISEAGVIQLNQKKQYFNGMYHDNRIKLIIYWINKRIFEEDISVELASSLISQYIDTKEVSQKTMAVILLKAPLFHLLQKGHQCSDIIPILENLSGNDIPAVHCNLYIISGGQLGIPHMLLLHMHESSISVRLGIAVSSLKPAVMQSKPDTATCNLNPPIHGSAVGQRLLPICIENICFSGILNLISRHHANPMPPYPAQTNHSALSVNS